MRLLHARHRDEPVRALSRVQRRHDAATKSTTCWPEICAAAPATGRSSTRRSKSADRRRRSVHPQCGGAAGRRSAALDDKADLFVGDETSLSSPRRRASSRLAQLYTQHPDATIVAGATDVGLWITKKLTPIEKIIHVGRVAELSTQSRRRADGFAFGAIVSLARAAAGAGLDRSRHCRSAAPVRLDAGARLRHGRRQYRQRLADRRSRADADCAGRHAGAAPRRSSPRNLPLENFFLDYGKQDRAAGRIRAPAVGAEAAVSRRIFAPTRSPSVSTRIFPRCWRRFA